jgi:hypothetical protein
MCCGSLKIKIPACWKVWAAVSEKICVEEKTTKEKKERPGEDHGH